MPSVVRGRRPMATSTASPSIAAPSESATRTTLSPETASAFTPSFRLHAGLLEAGGDLVARELLQAAAQLGPPTPPGRARAERRVGLRELRAHRAAAEHEQALGHLGRGRRLAVGPWRRSRRGRRSAASRRAFRWRRPPPCWRSARCPPAHTRRSPSSRPSPRNSSIPFFSSQGAAPESSRPLITSSRRVSAAATSSSPLHRLRRARHPAHLGQRLAGRSRAFEGMQA